MRELEIKAAQIVSELEDLHRRAREFEELDRSTLHRAQILVKTFLYDVEGHIAQKRI